MVDRSSRRWRESRERQIAVALLGGISLGDLELGGGDLEDLGDQIVGGLEALGRDRLGDDPRGLLGEGPALVGSDPGAVDLEAELGQLRQDGGGDAPGGAGLRVSRSGGGHRVLAQSSSTCRAESRTLAG